MIEQIWDNLNEKGKEEEEEEEEKEPVFFCQIHSRIERNEITIFH